MQELTKVRVKKLCAKVLHVEGMCVKDCEGIVFCVQKLSVEESCVKDMYVEEVFVKGLCAEEIYAEELHANERCTRVLCATCGRGAPRPVTETDGLQQMSGCLRQSNHLGRTSS